MTTVNVPGVGPVNFPEGMSERDIIRAIEFDILPSIRPAAPAPVEQERQPTNIFRDVPGAIVSGVGGLGTAAGGLYGLVSGDFDNVATRAGRSIQEFSRDNIMSPGLRQRQDEFQQRLQAVQDQGLGTQALEAVRGLASDPYLFGTMAVEQIPQLAASLGIGRVGGAVGQVAARRAGVEAGEQAARRGATGAAIGASTGLQTGEVANSTYEDIMRLAPEVIERSSNYQDLRQTMTDQEARETLAIRGAREAAAIAAPLSAASATLLPGVERMAFAQRAQQAALSRVLGGAIFEAGQEGIEEGGGRFAQNVGVRNADEDRSLGQGVGSAAATGAVLGAGIGGGFAALRGGAPQPEARGEDPDLQRALNQYLTSLNRSPAEPGSPDLNEQARVVSEVLPVTAEQFMDATPRDQAILLARAQRQVEGRLAGQNLPVLDPQGNRDPETANIRVPQSASSPSDEMISGEAGSRAQSFQFEEGRGELMDDGMTQAEFFRRRAEEMARQGRPAPTLAADESLLQAARSTQVAPQGTPAEQTIRAARQARAEQDPLGAFFPLVEGYIAQHIQQNGQTAPISMPAFQAYVRERTGQVMPLSQARDILRTYNDPAPSTQPVDPAKPVKPASLDAPFPAINPRARVKELRPVERPASPAPGEGFVLDETGRSVAPRGATTDEDGRPLWRSRQEGLSSLSAPAPADATGFIQGTNQPSLSPSPDGTGSDKRRIEATSPPTAPLRAGPSGFTDPRLGALSAREAGATDQSAPAQPAQNTEAVERARKVVEDRLSKLEKRGGKNTRDELVRVMRDGKFNSQQVYAAFMAADQIASLLPTGANHNIEFVDRLLISDRKAAQASGNVDAQEAQGERLRPTGSVNRARFQQLMREGATADQAFAAVQREATEGIIRLSLAPNQLPILRETAAHEAFHVLQDYYGKYDPQFSKLMGQSFRDGMMITDVDPTIRRKLEQARFPNSKQSYWQALTSTLKNPMDASEAQAYAFGALMDASRRGTPMTGLKPAFARFVNLARQFFTRLGNKLRGDGFQTVEDVLGRVAQGDARRFDGRATPTDQDFQARGPQASARSSRASTPSAGTNPFPTPPADEVQARLRRMQKRRQSYLPGISNGPKNPRTELLDERGNIAWAVGKISFDDWITRVEANLNAREIKEARDWYPQAMRAYSQYFGKDWPSYLASWLMANQQASPSTAQMNAIRAREKVLSGSQGGPKAGLAEERLLPFWQAIEKGGGLPTGGAQKLYDFIDSGLLRPTRKWMGDDPVAGAPAVADVHSLRDVGFVDEVLREALVNKFGAQMNDIPADSSGSPGEAQYEMAADFMREVTDHLNSINYRGGGWTPYEVQAVGWMSTTKFMGNPGQTPFEAILYNIRDLNYELGFGEGAPYNEKFPLLARLPTQGQKEVSQKILNDVTDFARNMAGVKEFARVHATGGWLSDNVSPNARFQAIASPEAMVDMANIIGYLTQQTGMLPYRLLPNETVKGKLALRIYPSKTNDLATDENMSTLWQKLRKTGIKKSGAKGAPDLIQGFSTHEADGKAAMLLMFDGKGDRLLNRLSEGDVAAAVQRAADEMGIDLSVDVVYHESDYQQNDWRSQPDGEGYLQGLRSRFGSDVQARLRDYQRGELEPRLEAAIREAVERYGVRDGAQLSARNLDPAPGSAEARELRDAGGVRGGRGLLAPSGGAGDEAPLEGLPRRVKAPGIGVIEAGPFLPARRAAEDYMREAGLPYNPPTRYARVDPERAARIADAFEAMENNPNDPLVRASYEAMARETLAQWEAIKRTGFRAEFFSEDGSDPYLGNPRLAIEDVRNNNHMYVFPTETGYGQAGISDDERASNPMLRDTGERWNGRPVLVNDVFRAVHDYFGHAKEGVGFRADGEENAWRSHAAMYSPLARLAMTTETRGQNSWLNYGPRGDSNRTAAVEDTVFADQKLGVLPSWVHQEGAEDFLGPVSVEDLRRQIGGRQGGTDAPKTTDQQIQLSARATNLSVPEFTNWWNGGWRGDGAQPRQSLAVNPDGSPMTFYHGTQKSFRAFGKARSASHDQEGPFFFSPNPAFAEDYAVSAMYAGGGGERATEGQRMLPVYLSIQNVFDSTDPQRAQELLDYVDKAMDNETIDWRDIVSETTRKSYERQITNGELTENRAAGRAFRMFKTFLEADRNNWPAIETRAAQRYIRERGFDSFWVAELGTRNLAVYDPRQIKSIFNNFAEGTARSPQFSARSPLANDPSFQAVREKITGKDLDKPNVFSDGMRRFVGAKPGEKLSSAFVRTTINRAAPLWMLDRLAKEKGLSLKSAGLAMEVALNNSGRVQMYLEHGPLAYDPKTGDVTIREDAPGLIDAIKGRLNVQDKEEAQAYLVSLRERDLRRNGRKGFFNLTDAEVNSTISKSEAAHPEWKEMAADIQRINKALLDFAVNTSTLDRSMADQLASMFYTPFYRQAETDAKDEDNAGSVVGPRLSESLTNVKTAFDVKAKGGEKPLGDLFENMIRNADVIMKAGMKNVAMRQAAETMEAVGLGRGVNERETGKTITYRVNGKDKHFEVDDAVLYTTLAGAPREFANGIYQTMANVAGFFRDMITAAPSFMLANLWRGKVMAYVQEGVPFYTNTFNGLRQALKASSSYKAIAAQTGFGGYTYGMGERDAAAAFEREIQGLGYGPGGMMRRAFDVLQKASEATEMAERIKLYERMKAQGMTDKEAAYQAYLLAPFSRRGMGSGWVGYSVNWLVPLVPFLNAKIQGMYRLYENEKGDSQKLWTLGLPKQMFLRGLVVMGASLALAAKNMADEPERWDNETPDLKLRYDIVYLPDGKRLLLPRAFEVGNVFGALPVFIMDAIRREDGRDMAKLLTDIGTSTFFFNPIPMAIIPILSATTNYDFFRGRALETAGDMSKLPEERVNRNTSTVARLIGEGAGVSPIRIQALMEGYSGTIGTSVLAGFDAILAGMGLVPNKPAGAFGDPLSMPAIVAGLTGANRFYRTDDQTASRFVGDFYKIKEQVDQLNRSLTGARERQDTARIAELQGEAGIPLRLRPMVNAASRQLTSVNEQMRRLEQQGLSSEELAARLKPLRERRDQITRRVVERARELGM